MNNITIIGNISKPVLRMTNSGKSFFTFGLAVNRKVGEQEKTTWFNVKAWGELAENLAAVSESGTRVIVMGYIENDEYEDKDGNTQKTTTVIAQDAGVSQRWASKG